MTRTWLDLLFKVWKFCWTRCAQATSCFPKKSNIPLTVSAECIKTQKPKGNLEFWISGNNHEIVCFLKLLCFFSQRVYPKYVFPFLKNTKVYHSCWEINFFKIKKHFILKTCFKKDTKMWIFSGKYWFVSKTPRLQKIVKMLICDHFGKIPLKTMLKSW